MRSGSPTSPGSLSPVQDRPARGRSPSGPVVQFIHLVPRLPSTLSGPARETWHGCAKPARLNAPQWTTLSLDKAGLQIPRKCRRLSAHPRGIDLGGGCAKVGVLSASRRT